MPIRTAQRCWTCGSAAGARSAHPSTITRNRRRVISNLNGVRLVGDFKLNRPARRRKPCAGAYYLNGRASHDVFAEVQYPHERQASEATGGLSQKSNAADS